MTREEKLKKLNDIYAEMNESENAVCYLTSDDNEVIQCAIKVLEQEPCEDCISREAVLNTLENMDKALTEDRTVETYKELLIACINDLIPVYQEPKTGHWIIHNESITLLTGEIATGGVICSECGYKTHNKAHVMWWCPYKYCPNCGCRMESEV